MYPLYATAASFAPSVEDATEVQAEVDRSVQVAPESVEV